MRKEQASLMNLLQEAPACPDRKMLRLITIGAGSFLFTAGGILLVETSGNAFSTVKLIAASAAITAANLALFGLSIGKRWLNSPLLGLNPPEEEARGPLLPPEPAELTQPPLSAEETEEIAASVRSIASTIRRTAGAQSVLVDEVSASVMEISRSIGSIAEDADQLLSSAETASSATQQISATIKEVATTTESLDTAADTIQSAVNQIASSLKQVTANLVLLAELTGSAGSSAARIDNAIKDISDHARDQADIARDVKDTAATSGLDAVESTKQGMERIREEVFTTNASIESLSSRSEQIGEIVAVIRDVADETNLLALNATILAAQSGEHGKAFAVIADKIRALARRSADSTKAIGEIIRQVQRDIQRAGKSVKRSIVEVDNGVTLSTSAANALTEIVTKAETSLEMALEVEASIATQSKNVELNASAIRNFDRMSGDIKKAVTKQSQSADAIVRGVKELRSGTAFVKQTISEQAITSESIAEVVNEVFQRSQVIAHGNNEQSQVAQSMLAALASVEEEAGTTLALCDDLESAISAMERKEAPRCKEEETPCVEPEESYYLT